MLPFLRVDFENDRHGIPRSLLMKLEFPKLGTDKDTLRTAFELAGIKITEGPFYKSRSGLPADAKIGDEVFCIKAGKCDFYAEFVFRPNGSLRFIGDGQGRLKPKRPKPRPQENGGH